MNLLKLCRNQWDRTIAVAFVLGGFVALLVGWLAVSDTILAFEQIPYVISGGVLAVCLVTLGAASWISADLRDEWRKLDDLEVAVKALVTAEDERPGMVLPDRSEDHRERDTSFTFEPSGVVRAPGAV